MKRLILAAAMVAAPLTAQQPAATPVPAATPTPAATPAPLASPAPVASPTPDPSLPQVAIVTSEGRFVLALETKRAPITAANFLRYVDQKRLDGTSFYRAVVVGPGIGLVQAGTRNDPKKTLKTIPHEPTTLTGVKHLEGTISTARLGLGTARGEFTIMVGDQPGLDADPSKPGDNQGYAAFGRVVEGLDVVLKIFELPIDPAATVRGSFKGEVPARPVRILTARRVRAAT